ncbi:ABC transporter ATP-binding protein [Rhodoligotrophos defluvii]|uniref:ABC transporter ATP-binding protein n=1 Tax=Rhodoligotrophos defluvii TaxID=2561934 RepID=UPI0010C937D7|nr:ATP-binding cassette domain-containing protein [Rhodoligotrophos defluvii]
MNAPAPIRELSVAGLSVRSAAGPIVRDVSLLLRPGTPVTLLGESGSGKSLVAQAVMGTLPPDLEASGTIRLDGMNLFSAPPGERRKLWGRRIALLPQEPWLALDPTMRTGEQVAEVHRFVHGRGVQDSSMRAENNLGEVGLGQAGALYPFQMSGGMCQRVAIAIAHASDSGLLIADEPTKGLDADLRDSVVARLKQEIEAGRLLLTITHDIAVARALGGTVGVMLEGRLVDYGPANEVLTSPSHGYSRALFAADPEAWPRRTPPPAGNAVIAGRGLAKSFGDRTVFKDLDVEVRAGEVVAIVGPSGCGKTTAGNVLLGLVLPDVGRVERRGGVAPFRFQKLYQDPPAAFAPHQTIRKGLEDLVRLHRREWRAVERLLVRLKLQHDLLDRLPNQISGGELQRFAILRTLLLDPVFLFADEATSRLDPLSQKEVIELLLEIVEKSGLGLLLVTHDLALAERVATRMIRLGAV